MRKICRKIFLLWLIAATSHLRSTYSFLTIRIPKKTSRISIFSNRMLRNKIEKLPVSASGLLFAFQSTFKLRPRDLSRRLGVRAMSLSDITAHNSNGDEDYSLEHLHTRMQSFLAQYTGHVRMVVAIAGGGSHFLSTLASTPGASAVLLEGTVTYDRSSFHDYVSMNVHESSADQKTSQKNAAADDAVVSATMPSSEFRYVSDEASQMLSEAALRRALHLTARGVKEQSTGAYHNGSASSSGKLMQLRKTVGVAITSKLQSGDVSSSTRRAVARVVQLNGPPVTLEATLTKDFSTEEGVVESRSRWQEDVFVSHILLTCLVESLKFTVTKELHENNERSDNFTSIQEAARTAMGDMLELRVPHFSYPTALETVNRFIHHGEPCIMLIPDKRSDKRIQWRPLPSPTLPPNSLIVSGSFNPPHHGHVGLAKAALHATNHTCPAVLFELALTNADKVNEWNAEKVLERLEGFGRLDELDKIEWGVLLTSKAPLFVDKAYLLDPLQAKRNGVDGKEEQQLWFVIGTDTLVRMVDPKYYGNSRDVMLDTLRRMPCRFVVGGRVQQGERAASDSVQAEFVSGQEQVDQLPVDLQHKFVLMPDFRIDISSTELRKKKGKKK